MTRKLRSSMQAMEAAEAAKDYGEVAIVDPATDKTIKTMRVAGHPAELLLNHSGSRLFVFVSIASKIQVIDTKEHTVVANLAGQQVSGRETPRLMRASERLLIGTRNALRR